MRQSHEFATAFAATVERSPKKKEAIVEMITNTQAGVLYAKGSREFEEGLDKIPQELLDLLKSQFASEVETVSEIGESIGYYMTVCDDLDLAEQYIPLCNSMTVEDLIEVAKKYLNINNAVISTLVPKK